MSESFKVGLLGLGFIGKRHLEASRSLPGVEVFTRSSPRFAALPQDQATISQAMIEDPELDAILICLPTGLHAPVTIAALDAGKHVLCEKPMALTIEDCSRMLLAAEQSRGMLMIAHVLRFWPAYTLLRRAVAERSYGDIRGARFVRKSGPPTGGEWLLRREESGGATLDMLVHDFDQALLLFGAPETAQARTVGSPNVMECSLQYAGGFEVAIAGGWYDSAEPFAMEFDVEASEGRLRFAENHLLLLRQGQGPVPIAVPDVDPYAAQLSYFVECCRSGRAPAECPPVSSAQAVELALAVSELAQGTRTDPHIRLRTPLG